MAEIGHNSIAYGQELGFDFIEFARSILLSSASSSAKLISIAIGLKAHDGKGVARPRRSEITHMASCSEATFKRTYEALKVFFEVSASGSSNTQYAPKTRVTASEIDAAISKMEFTKRSQNDTTKSNIGGKKRVQNATSLKKEIPPTPPKEKNNNIYNNHHSKETAAVCGGGEDLPGLNGSTSVVIDKLAGWIQPGMPDYVTARDSLEKLVSIYPPEIVRDSFAHLEAKMLSGDIVPKPLKYFMATCRGMNTEAEKERQKDKKPPGMSEKIWKRIQDDKAKAKANGGISLW